MQYTITAATEPFGDVPKAVWGWYAHFSVSPEMGQAFTIHVRMPWVGSQPTPAEQERPYFISRVEAIKRLRAYLDQGIQQDETIELPTDPAQTAQFRTTKYCKFFERTPKGPICKVWGNVDRLKGATSLHVCENSCKLPDTELLCSHVVHPETVTPGGFEDRGIASAHCELGLQNLRGISVSSCQLGEMDCWKLLYIPQAPSQEISLDLLADRVLAELRTVNMIFREQLKLEPFKPPDFATGREFLRECSHPEDLSNNLNALTDIFAHMDFKQFLSQVPPGTKSIKHLSLFLGEKFAGREEDIVQTFRDIRTLALYYPRHAKLDEPILEAHRRLLRLTPPISDYGNAWRTILQRLLEALRDLKNLMLE